MVYDFHIKSWLYPLTSLLNSKELRLEFEHDRDSYRFLFQECFLESRILQNSYIDSFINFEIHQEILSTIICSLFIWYDNKNQG